MIGYTILVVIGTALITLALNAFWEYYQTQKERTRLWEKQELLATIDRRIEQKLKEIIKDEI